jgi:hypothetical protein
MESTCYLPDCSNKPAFCCKCKSPSILVCDAHFSAHVQSKGYSHEYEFLSAFSAQEKPRPVSKLKNIDIQKLLENLPAATRLSISHNIGNINRSPNREITIKPAIAIIPRQDNLKKHYYSENEYYEGEWDEKENGTGKYVGQVTYEGGWKSGLPHGTGELILDQGKFSGSWYEGLISGPGTLLLSNGDQYVGEFQDCKFQGNGVYYFNNNVQVSGYFREHYLVKLDYYSLIPLNYIKSIEKLKNEPYMPIRFLLLSQIFNTPLVTVTDFENTFTDIKFFKNNSLTAVTIYVDSFKKTEETVVSSHKLSNAAGICEIQGMLCHVGGLIDEKSTGNCFLFNLVTSEITWIESCKRRSSPCIVNINTKIFAFGGSDQFLSFISIAEAYDFTNHNWKDIPPMPHPSDGMSGGSIGNLALISGYLHTKAYVYDTQVSHYAEILDLPDFKEKVFCVGAAKCFLMCNKKLYESNPGNPFEWKMLRDIVYTSGWPIGNPIRKGNLFYWYTTDKELWKFDLETNGVFLLKKFK